MKTREDIRSYLENHRADMIRLLKRLVCIQSGTYNKAGVDEVGAVIHAEMKSLGFICEFEKQADYGHHLIARTPGTNAPQKPLLITGHMDTVFPRDTTFNFFKTDATHCYGPGVVDMKGGLVVGIFALKAIARAGRLTQTPLVFIFNSDEEIGSPTSEPLIREAARKSRMAFVLEAGGLNGEVVTGRKGNLSARLEITGEAGHAAFAGKNKASAILELAHQIIQIENLNHSIRGITANVGKIAGGIGPNTIARHAQALIDFRFLTDADGQKLQNAVRDICASPANPRNAIRLEIVTGRSAMPPSEANMALFREIKKVADGLGIAVTSEVRPGVSDANFIAAEGIPVIDGLGPIGAKDHSADEYMITASLLERTLLFSQVLLAMNQK